MLQHFRIYCLFNSSNTESQYNLLLKLKCCTPETVTLRNPDEFWTSAAAHLARAQMLCFPKPQYICMKLWCWHVLTHYFPGKGTCFVFSSSGSRRTCIHSVLFHRWSDLFSGHDQAMLSFLPTQQTLLLCDGLNWKRANPSAKLSSDFMADLKKGNERYIACFVF